MDRDLTREYRNAFTVKITTQRKVTLCVMSLGCVTPGYCDACFSFFLLSTTFRKVFVGRTPPRNRRSSKPRKAKVSVLLLSLFVSRLVLL